MYTEKEYITNLNKEISSIGQFTREDVYNLFKAYVENEDRLRKAVDLGVFHYDYVKYKSLFENTLFEDGLRLIVSLSSEASTNDPEKFKNIWKESYPQISKGFANYTQMCLLGMFDLEMSRKDLVVKRAFQIIGDQIENTFKPFIFLLNELRCIVQRKKSCQQKLGVAVNAMLGFSEILRALYSDMLLGVSISQWRNIADHGTYDYQKESIEIIYGSINKFKKQISMQELVLVLKVIDALLYMHKTAHTLITLDRIEWYQRENSYTMNSEETWQDNVVAQIVETSFAYGLELKELKKSGVNWDIALNNQHVQSKEELQQFFSIIATFLGGDFNVTIHRNEKVEYKAICINRALRIYKFVV